MIPHLPPIRVSIKRWSGAFDDVVFGPGYELLISTRFWILARDAGLTGLVEVGSVEIVSVKARDRKQLLPPEYQCVRTVLGRAAVDDLASGMVRNKPWTCEECRSGGVRRMERLILEPETWSGEDFFRPRGLRGTIVTSERVRAFCDRNRFNNVLLIPAGEYHFDFYPWRQRKQSES